MTVELHLGGDWLAAAQRLCNLRRQSDEPGWALSLSRINGTLDLVLGEDNITAAIPPDAALVFLVDLLDAATALCQGAPKTIVRFSETPWELILTPAGPDTVALSLLGTGIDPVAVAHNRPVVARELFDAMRGAATEIRAALLDLDPGFVDNPLVARLTQALAHLPSSPA